MDYYFQDSSRLENQPKRAIADYVESQGIRAPRRFISLADARRSHLPILCRSEYPLEYADVSDILQSFPLMLSRKLGIIRTEAEMKEKYAITDNSYFQGLKLLQQYYSLLGQNSVDILDQFSFSFWEKLRGINRMVVADDSIKGRYHITEEYRSHKPEKSWMNSYIVIENGDIVLREGGCYNFEAKDDYLGLIDFYEQVRNLSRFDSDNCPIIEIQTVGDDHYFLQYRKGRNFCEADFEIDPNEKSEKNVLFIRGHTPKEGISGKIVVYYADYMDGLDSGDWHIPENEFGATDFHYNWPFSNIMCPRRKVQIIYSSYKGNVAWELSKFALRHKIMTELFSSEVSLICDQDIFSREEIKKVYEQVKETGEDQGIDIHLVSDGRKALLSRI